MHGNVSSDQPRVGMTNSGALSHVYIQHPPLRCSIPETQGLYYDDGNKLVVSPTSDQILSWKIGASTQLDPPCSDSIGEGPILSIRYSLDGKVIGIHRSNHEVQFKNRETGETFSRRCRPDSESILGFFWTDSPSCDIIFVKTSGLDLLTYESELNTLRLVETKRFNVSWYVYTHESRMVLLASGMQCTIFYGFQFSSGGIVRLPKFEMTMAKAETNQKPVLSAEDVHIVTVYGRIYCMQHDRVGMVLYLYRFYRDAVVQQDTLPVYSSRIAVSVVDNVLLVHQVDAKVVILYDMFLESLSPVSAPLPLLLRGPSSNISKNQVQIEDTGISAYGGTIYGDSWTFLVPDLICDIDNGMIWRIHLDLEAISASSSDIPSVLEFLQRRRSEPAKIKTLCFTIMRTIILERRPISMIAGAIDAIVGSYSHSVKMENALQGGFRRSSPEKIQQTSIQNIHGSRIVSEESRTRMVSQGKSIKQESSSGGDFDPQQPRHPSTSEISTAPARSVSDSEINTNSEALRVSLRESIEKSSSYDHLASEERGERMKGVRAKISDAETEQSPLRCKELEHNSSQSVSNQHGSQFNTVAISPDEMYHFVLAHVEDEMGSDPAYFVAVTVEFLRSVSKERLKVPPNVYVMTIELLAHSKLYAELGFFVISKILEPSKEVAFQLLQSGRHDLQTRKLGMEMLRQLSLHHDYVTVLLQDGYHLEALRYARKNKVITVQPSLFLEAALATNNTQQFAAVLRFFLDFVPGFKDTSDCSRYRQILTEMT